MKDVRQMLINRMSEVHIRNAMETGDPAKIEQANTLFKDLLVSEVTISNIEEVGRGTQRYRADIDLSQRGGSVIKQYWSPANPTEALIELYETGEYSQNGDNVTKIRLSSKAAFLHYFNTHDLMTLTTTGYLSQTELETLFPFDPQDVRVENFGDYINFDGPFISGRMIVRDGKEGILTGTHDPVDVRIWTEDENGDKEVVLGDMNYFPVGHNVDTKFRIYLEDSPDYQSGDTFTVSYTGDYRPLEKDTLTYQQGQPLEIPTDERMVPGQIIQFTITGKGGFSCMVSGVVVIAHAYTYTPDGRIDIEVTYPEVITGSLVFKGKPEQTWHVPEDDQPPGMYLYDRGRFVHFVPMDDTTLNDFELPLLEPGKYGMYFRSPGSYKNAFGGLLTVNAPE